MTAHIGEDVEKEEYFPILVGLQTGTTTLEINLDILRKLEIELPEDPTIPFLGTYPKDSIPGHRGTSSTMFIAVFFVIARSWKQPRCPMTEEWIQDCGSFTQWNTTQLLSNFTRSSQLNTQINI